MNPNMMRQKLFISAIYLITTLFIFLIACEALKEDQSSERARVLCGNIPFNGGMFGKRSAPDLCKPSHVNEGEEYVDSDIEYAAEAEKYDGSAIRNSAPNPNMSQDESPVQASIHRCARALRSPELEQGRFLAILCQGFLSNKEHENHSWIERLFGLD